MSDAQDIADGLLELESDFPSTFTWSGTDFPCVTGATDASKTLGFGGFLPEADLIVNVVASRFTTAVPRLKETAVYTGAEFPQGRKFRIDRILSAPGNPFLQFHLADSNKAI